MDEFVRSEAILSLLERTGQVTVTELAAKFGVSTVTIRKDLEALEHRSTLRRVRGGAVSVSTSDEGMFSIRLRQSRELKRALAEKAAAEIRDGDVIAMDASTSVYYLAELLLDRRDLVVVTTALRTALLLTENSSALVLMPGGTVRHASQSLVGLVSDVLSSRGRIDKGFFGVKSVSLAHGLMELAPEEAQSKRYLADACDAVYALFDSTKVGRLGLHSFASTDTITAIYTDDNLASDDRIGWQAAGVEVRTVSVPQKSPEREQLKGFDEPSGNVTD